MDSYQTLYGLPALAGLASFGDAQRPRFSVEECVRRLKRYHYSLKRLHEIFIARLTSEPIYELKMAFSLHAHYCAEHVAALRQRVSEMREPPLGLDTVPDENLAIYFDEIAAAPDTLTLLSEIYESALPSLVTALVDHKTTTNPLSDAPSVRLIKYALLEAEEMITYGHAALAALRATGKFSGQVNSTGEVIDLLSPPTLTRRRSVNGVAYDLVPRRDERFPDPYNMGVNAEAFLYDASLPPEPKVLMMFYKRLREIDVPEMMASIITETKGKPWAYYRDMTRQLWDEARHAMMGEVGFISLGINWPQSVMVNFTWSLGLNTQLTPKERHGVLYFIEQGLMPKSGKRYEWETAQAAHHALSAHFQDYDWADEVLHARVGRDWYVSQFESPKEAVEWGDKAWSKVLIGWRQWQDAGLTQHRNWWTDLYQDYCRARGLDPEPSVLGFSESYEQKRADLKMLPVSA